MKMFGSICIKHPHLPSVANITKGNRHWPDMPDRNEV